MRPFVALCAAVACVWAQSGCYTGNRGQQICYVVGDLTKTTADALVNAANSQLSHGGGIAGALSVACGPQLQMASDAIVNAGGSIPVSETAVTSSFNLANLARDIIHVVGPMYDPTQDAYMRILLRNAVWNVLRTARLACDLSVAIPPISSNIFGFPLQAATDTIMDAISDYYLYVYDQPDGVLSPALVASGASYNRFVDRSPCADLLVPANVSFVAWANRDMEAGAVQNSFDRVMNEEATRRKALGLSASAQYSVSATTTVATTTTTTDTTSAVTATDPTATTAATDSSSGVPSSSPSSSSSAASASSGRGTSHGVTNKGSSTWSNTDDGSSMASDPAGLDYCGPLPVPCWSIALFAGLLLCCIGLMGASAWLCMRNRADNRYRQLDEPVSSRR